MPCSICLTNGHNAPTCSLPRIIKATNIFNKYIDDAEEYDIVDIANIATNTTRTSDALWHQLASTVGPSTIGMDGYTKEIVKYLHSIYTDGFVGNDPQYPRNMILPISHNGSLHSFVQIDINLVRDEDQPDQRIFKKPEGVDNVITYTKNIEQGCHKYNRWMTHYFIPNCYGVDVLTNRQVNKMIRSSQPIEHHFRMRQHRLAAAAVPAVPAVPLVPAVPAVPAISVRNLVNHAIYTPPWMEMVRSLSLTNVPSAAAHPEFVRTFAPPPERHIATQPRRTAQLRPRPRAPRADAGPSPQMQISVAREQMSRQIRVAQEADLHALQAEAIAQYAGRHNITEAVALLEEAVALRAIAEMQGEDATRLRNTLHALRANTQYTGRIAHLLPGMPRAQTTTTIRRPPPVELCSLQEKVIDVENCPICMNDVGNTDKAILRCGHQICVTCILTNIEFLSKNKKKYHCECPICRGAYYNLK